MAVFFLSAVLRIVINVMFRYFQEEMSQIFLKNLSIEQLLSERPTSIHDVRQSLFRAIEHAEQHLDDMERSFYEGQREGPFIQTMVAHCIKLMPVFKISNWNASDQTTSMWAKVVDPAAEEDYEDLLTPIRELHSFDLRIKEFIPGRFQVIVEAIDVIMKHIRKYLLSFYDGKEAPYLETYFHYEQRKKELSEAIAAHIKNIFDMGETYRSPEGLLSVHFGLHVNEIARAKDCGRILILLIFPQAIQNARNSLKGLHKWLQADQEYVEFLQCDLKSLGRKQEEETCRLNAMREACWTLDHRLQNTCREAMEAKAQVTKMPPPSREPYERHREGSHRANPLHGDGH
jgi:hypothetical protein